MCCFALHSPSFESFTDDRHYESAKKTEGGGTNVKRRKKTNARATELEC